jgi:NAD(P)-dependent dehydrogenase (short-subunit alcohol dehydrogenase family)
MSMKDKTVVITGATSGLGRATALQLARKGASVVAVARSNGKANELVDEIKGNAGKARSIIADLSSMKETKGAAQGIAED